MLQFASHKRRRAQNPKSEILDKKPSYQNGRLLKFAVAERVRPSPCLNYSIILYSHDRPGSVRGRTLTGLLLPKRCQGVATGYSCPPGLLLSGVLLSSKSSILLMMGVSGAKMGVEMGGSTGGSLSG